MKEHDSVPEAGVAGDAFRLLAPLVVALAVTGCARPGGDGLTIATTWSSGDRRAIEAERGRADPTAAPIVWVALAPGDDPARLGVDLLLGVAGADLDRLDGRGELVAIDPNEPRPWRVSRRLTLGLVVDRGRRSKGEGSFTFDDPRRDPVTLAWAKSRPEAEGHGGLVRAAGRAVAVGRRTGSATLAVERGEAASGPSVGVAGALDDRAALVALDPPRGWLEGVALVRGSPLEAEARGFVALLASFGQAEPVPAGWEAPDLAADALLADLLGAVVVDAREELIDALDALDRAGRPRDLDAYLDRPPPWPPTSVAKLRARPDPQPLLETLAREITPDRDARFWLIDGWDRPERPVDRDWLREAARAADGRLAREPRFRAWLRGEWSAWARQHYRRIAREAGKAMAAR